MAMYIDYPFSQVEFTCDNCGKKEYVEDCTTEKEATWDLESASAECNKTPCTDTTSTILIRITLLF